MIVNDIKEAIINLFSFEVLEENDNNIIFKIYEEKQAILDKDHVKQLILEINSMTTENDIELCDNYSYEVIVRN